MLLLMMTMVGPGPIVAVHLSFVAVEASGVLAATAAAYESLSPPPATQPLCFSAGGVGAVATPAPISFASLVQQVPEYPFRRRRNRQSIMHRARTGIWGWAGKGGRDRLVRLQVRQRGNKIDSLMEEKNASTWHTVN